MNVQIIAPCGATIEAVAMEACEVAAKMEREVFFKFNDTEIWVKPKSYFADIVAIYYLKRDRNA